MTNSDTSGASAVGGLTGDADVTDPGQVETFMAVATAILGGLDILVNNAGAARPGRFDELTDARMAAQEVPLGRFGRPDEVAGLAA